MAEDRAIDEGSFEDGGGNEFPDDDVKNLMRVSQCYETIGGRDNLLKDIPQAVEVGKKPSAALRGLAQSTENTEKNNLCALPRLTTYKSKAP